MAEVPLPYAFGARQAQSGALQGARSAGLSTCSLSCSKGEGWGEALSRMENTRHLCGVAPAGGGTMRWPTPLGSVVWYRPVRGSKTRFGPAWRMPSTRWPLLS